MSIAAVILTSGESRASTVVVARYANNHLVKHSHEISQKLTIVQSVVFQSALGNLGTGKDNFLPCWNQERSPFISTFKTVIIG
ncbi:hypothetical protein GTQ43_05825 [Nostoc sp. KVJ3]|uniref:hypothetical protein n=1 Tax=Nostoc sp. KVJ3 TaxID=457945 RepID=UPI0022384B63|nr:hypothetical protein [Nostoc sp. KVJ3]MCW5313342.1 hypothetical protein [Nostoc sp. KVJ3]